ncbi:MAG: GNAT family N-acetyltransferase [Candidatus Melainabacteria bacterium]
MQRQSNRRAGASAGGEAALKRRFGALATTPFESDALKRVWWETLGGHYPIVRRAGDWAVQENRMLKGLLGLNEVRLAGWNNMWDQLLTRERVAVFERDVMPGRWHYLRTHWSERYDAAQAVDALESLGLTPVMTPGQTQYMIDLREGWHAYWQALSKRTRRDTEQKLKQAAGLKPELFEWPLGDAGMDAFFEAFFPAHRDYWDRKTGYSYFNIEAERAFVPAWLRALRDEAGAGKPMLHGLRMGGRVVNLSVSVVHGDTLYWMLTINLGAHTDRFPGIIGLYHQIQQAAEAGVSFYNLGSGEYFYKKRFATMALPGRVLLAANPRSPLGRLYVPRLAGRLHALEAAHEIPARLTRWQR